MCSITCCQSESLSHTVKYPKKFTWERQKVLKLIIFELVLNKSEIKQVHFSLNIILLNDFIINCMLISANNHQWWSAHDDYLPRPPQAEPIPNCDPPTSPASPWRWAGSLICELHMWAEMMMESLCLPGDRPCQRLHHSSPSDHQLHRALRLREAEAAGRPSGWKWRTVNIIMYIEEGTGGWSPPSWRLGSSFSSDGESAWKLEASVSGATGCWETLHNGPGVVKEM